MNNLNYIKYKLIMRLKLFRRLVLKKLGLFKRLNRFPAIEINLESSHISSINYDKQNIILGLAYKYKRDDIFIFAESLRKFDITSRVILVCEVNPDILFVEYCLKNKIELISWDYAEEFDSHLLNERFKVYSLIIQSIIPRPDKIFITDVRDVYFQSNLFESVANLSLVKNINDFLILFSETDNKIFRDCIINSFWYEYAFGKNELRKIRNEKVICAGTIFGDFNSMIKYLGLQNSLNKYIRQSKIFGSVLNTDQAIHNYIYYKLKTQLSNIIIDDKSIVSTLSGLSISEYLIKDKIYIKGVASSVLHQYDRVEEIKEHIAIKYKF